MVFGVKGAIHFHQKNYTNKTAPNFTTTLLKHTTRIYALLLLYALFLYAKTKKSTGEKAAHKMMVKFTPGWGIT